MPHATSHVNTTSHLVAMPRLVSWKYRFPRETLAFDTRNTEWHHACKNEVVIERYRIVRVLTVVQYTEFIVMNRISDLLFKKRKPTYLQGP